MKELMAGNEAPEEQYVRLGYVESVTDPLHAEFVNFNENTPLGDLLDHEAATEVLEKYMPGIYSSPMSSIRASYSLKQLAAIPQSGISNELLITILADLSAIK
ncbi:hypothetical protein [Paenibacillus sp. P3E]|uniref:hypothetical protein n=1 Tax=Paenibacillus sp. P3E TaxID=1349435 RepID=UPI001160F5F4|nr:hypothetical protein [Paenibacillus sp. P3E]